MVSNERFGIASQKQSDIITDICRGQTVTEETKKKLETATMGYILLQKHYASYMIFCLVYENVQIHLLATAECSVTTDNILWNAVILVQCLWFIENRERLSPKDARIYEENISESNHDLGFTSYGIDDFMSNKKKLFYL
jgi:hypothetical protein